MRFLCFGPSRGLDLSHIFFLMCKRKRGPECFGLGVSVDDFLEVVGHLDLALILVKFHNHRDGISGLTFSAGPQFGVDHHHVAFAHIHQRTAKGKAINCAFDGYPALALEHLHHVEWRLQGRDLGACFAEKLNLEVVLSHDQILPLDIAIPDGSRETKTASRRRF